MSNSRPSRTRKPDWRIVLLLFIALGSLVFLLSLSPILQDPIYHDFADRRALLGMPNFWDVLSNLPFLPVGIAGMVWGVKHRPASSRRAWQMFFVGVALVCFGSAYYHWHPTNATLVWDRLSMVIVIMSLFVALLAEYVDARLGRILLLPALLAGLSSVLYWQLRGDLRWYVWIQFMPLLVLPVLIVSFRANYSRQWLLAVALACYVLAKIAEAYDHTVFLYTGGLCSGHTLKHLLSALACGVVLVMLATRRPIAPVAN
jgi:hypothetical protein